MLIYYSGLDASLENVEIPYVYFATFDGHAGSGCAVTAANELHQVLHHKLAAVLQHLVRF
jgi:serine/threonine protein phosphatase PrpC